MTESANALTLTPEPEEVESGGAALLTVKVPKASRGSLVAVWDAKGLGEFDAVAGGEIGAIRARGETEVAVTVHPRGNPKVRWYTAGVRGQEGPYEIRARIFKFGGDLREFLRKVRGALELMEEGEESE